MSIEVTIKQTGFIKKELPFDVLCGGGLKYGYWDTVRLEPDKIGTNEFILYHPAHIARGFSVVWKKGEKNSIDLRLLLPSCAEEIDDFYDTIERIARTWKNCTIEQDGLILNLKDLSAQRNSMKVFSLDALKQFCSDDRNPLTIFCAFWPLVLGKKEKNQLIQSKDLSAFRDYLHQMQSIDVYFAKPAFYKTENSLIGVYVLTEDTRSIFPNKPYVPFGITDASTQKALDIKEWYVSIYSTTKKNTIGQVTYEDFLAAIKNKTYYDDGNFIVENLSLKELEKIIE